MRLIVRWLAYALGLVVFFVLAAAAFVYAASERKLRQTYDVAPALRTVPARPFGNK